MYEPTQIEVKRKMIETDARNDAPKSLRTSRLKKLCGNQLHSRQNCLRAVCRLSLVARKNVELAANDFSKECEPP